MCKCSWPKCFLFNFYFVLSSKKRMKVIISDYLSLFIHLVHNRTCSIWIWKVINYVNIYIYIYTKIWICIYIHIYTYIYIYVYICIYIQISKFIKKYISNQRKNSKTPQTFWIEISSLRKKRCSMTISASFTF